MFVCSVCQFVRIPSIFSPCQLPVLTWTVLNVKQLRFCTFSRSFITQQRSSEMQVSLGQSLPPLEWVQSTPSSLSSLWVYTAELIYSHKQTFEKNCTVGKQMSNSFHHPWICNVMPLYPIKYFCEGVLKNSVDVPTAFLNSSSWWRGQGEEHFIWSDWLEWLSVFCSWLFLLNLRWVLIKATIYN